MRSFLSHAQELRRSYMASPLCSGVKLMSIVHCFQNLGLLSLMWHSPGVKGRRRPGSPKNSGWQGTGLQDLRMFIRPAAVGESPMTTCFWSLASLRVLKLAVW